LFFAAKVDSPEAVTSQAFDGLVALLAAFKTGNTQALTNGVIGLIVLRAAAKQVGIDDQTLNRTQLVFNQIQRVLPRLPPTHFDITNLPTTDSRILSDARTNLVDLITDLSAKSSGDITNAPSFDSLFKLEKQLSENTIPPSVLNGEQLTTDTANQIIKSSANLLLYAIKGFQLAKSPSLEQCFELIKLSAYLLRTLAVLISQTSKEAIRTLQRFNSRCLDFVESIFLDGDLPPLCGLKNEQRSLFKIMFTILTGFAELNSARSGTLIEESWKAVQDRQQSTLMQAVGDFNAAATGISRMNRNPTLAQRFSPAINAFQDRFRKFIASSATADLSNLLVQEYYVAEALYSISQVIIEMEESSQASFDRETASRLPIKVEIPLIAGAASGDSQLVPTLYRIGQNLKRYHDLYWSGSQPSQILTGFESFFSDAKTVITETIRLSMMSVSLKNYHSLRETAERFGNVINGFLFGLRGKFLANPSWLPECEDSFMQIAPSLEAIRKVVEETGQLLSSNAAFLNQYGQILNGLRQVITQFDGVINNLHQQDLSGTRELAVEVVELLKLSSITISQGLVFSREVRMDATTSSKAAIALLGVIKNVLNNATPDGVVGVIPQLEEVLKEIEIGFPDDGEDGSRLNAEGRKLTVAVKKLGLRLARLKAENAKLVEGKPITPFTNNELHAWFVERLALESKIQANKLRLEELQKELNAIAAT
jgi:hypothetical protein